jgi:hypothetical protein
VYKTPPAVVNDENVTVDDALRVVVEIPVAPVMAPVPVILIDGVLMKFVNPVADAKLIPLIILESLLLAAGKLIPYVVLVPLGLVALDKAIFIPLAVA